VSNPSLANPARASGMVRMEAARRAVRAVVITRSAPMRSEIRARNMEKRTKDVYIISHVDPVVEEDRVRSYSLWLLSCGIDSSGVVYIVSGQGQRSGL